MDRGGQGWEARMEGMKEGRKGVGVTDGGTEWDGDGGEEGRKGCDG